MPCWPPFVVISLIAVMLIAAMIRGASIAIAIRLGRDERCDYCRIVPDDEPPKE